MQRELADRGGAPGGALGWRGALGDRRVALGATVALAVAVRLAGIGDRLSADEGYSWLVASAPDVSTFLDRLAAWENTPPLLYLLLAPLPLGDEVWLRLPVLVAGVAAVPVLYAIVRPLAGTAAALLSALALAVAPYAVSFSNYSRGFMLATLGLLVAVWGAARLAQGGPRRWWLLYAAGAAIALYSEYYAALTLVALVGALLAIGTPGRRETALLGLLPLAALAPFAWEIDRSLDPLDVTKVAPSYPGPSPTSLRDILVPLAFGEHGSANAAGLRWLQALLVLAVAVAATAWLWHRSRTAFWLLAGTGAGTLALHALAAAAGPDVFAQRYLTVLIPLGAALVGSAVVAIPWRAATPVTAAALVALGAAVFVQRHGRELEPDPEPVRATVEAAGAGTVLTNSATLAYYLRDRGAVLDRPFGLGPGLADACTKKCLRPVLIADDTRVGTGTRPAPGPPRTLGPFVVRIEVPAPVQRRATSAP